MDDFFAPSARQSTTRLVDYSALKRRVVKFNAEVMNGILRADETQEVRVQPPKVSFDSHSDDEELWCNSIAAQLIGAGLERCASARQYMQKAASVWTST